MKVFVYGTLKKNNSNNHILSESEYLGETKIRGYSLYAHKTCAFPFACKNPGGIIEGEVYNVNDHTLQRLLNLEGFPHVYGIDIVRNMVVFVFRNPKILEKYDGTSW